MVLTSKDGTFGMFIPEQQNNVATQYIEEMLISTVNFSYNGFNQLIEA